ncbi:alpha-ketoacid dehydrogenase subunit alpha/beta [Caenimonas aquaedulcis]|uniref:Transketolase n=1 Tax=Caenimonas aquaedulcis TaxID=2793270 RepID=A0A931H828_9BURK|nr:alpha-ketoacid dehydrogenase subunit alpha/beta [Caenimonas aquaedulcis]MBG9390441.1 transketolase [Caenimonas aquaedulcis]
MTQVETDQKASFLLDAYRRMSFIRSFESTALSLTKGDNALIAGSAHFCAGQEAVPVGALAALGSDDQVVATYRGHGWALESGIGARELLAELCHKAEGINGGRAGSALVMAPHKRFLGENSIVGAGLPIACGAALASASAGANRVVVVSFGDGATSQGAVHEALVFAASRQLPVIFICENNGWSEMTSTSSIVKVPRLARRAIGYGMLGVTVDGSDPEAVRSQVADAAARARAGEGPSLIECLVPRLWGHYNRDIEHYRPPADRSLAKTRDPLAAARARLLELGQISAGELDAIDAEAASRMEVLAAEVRQLAAPDAKTATAHVVGEAVVSRTDAARTGASTGAGTEMTYIQAVNRALRRELEDRPEVLVFGEDVGHAGGIFGASRDLQKEFGAERVFDTPIAESAILGGAVGAAMCGKRPVVEIMWADFMLVALDQLINQAANVRYLTRGRLSVPMVVRTQQGATPGSCAQHAQCLETLLAHIPGLRVGLPSCAEDAYAMLRAAVADEDPCVIIESRALYQSKGIVDLDAPLQHVGGARLRADGKDILLAGWGSIVPVLMGAAALLRERGIEASVLDLRWLAPLDEGAIEKALKHCGGRIVVAHEANLTGGFGGEIVARLIERCGPSQVRFRRVASPNIRMPASPALQAAVLPDASRIADAACELVDAGVTA